MDPRTSRASDTPVIANSAFAALVASRAKNRRWHIVSKGIDADREFLSTLSIEHLLIDHLFIGREMYETLLELGVRTMGDLAGRWLPSDRVRPS